MTTVREIIKILNQFQPNQEVIFPSGKPEYLEFFHAALHDDGLVHIELCKSGKTSKSAWYRMWDCGRINKSDVEFLRKLRNSKDPWKDDLWYKISENSSLPDEFLLEFADLINWHVQTKNLFSYGEVDLKKEERIKKFEKHVDWGVLSAQATLSENFMLEYADRLDWKYINEHNECLTIRIIEENSDRVKWHGLYKNFNEKEVKYLKVVRKLTKIVQTEKLTREFIYKYASALNWRLVLKHQKHLGIKFLGQLRNEVNATKKVFGDWF